MTAEGLAPLKDATGGVLTETMTIQPLGILALKVEVIEGEVI